MNLPLAIYFISVADNIAQLSYLAVIVVGMGTLFLILNWATDECERKTYEPIIKKCFIGLSIALLIAVTIPNTKTSYTILAAYGGQAVLESETAKRIAPKSIAMIEQFLDEKILEKSK